MCANLVQGDKFPHVMDGGYKVRIMIERRGLTMIKWPFGRAERAWKHSGQPAYNISKFPQFGKLKIVMTRFVALICPYRFSSTYVQHLVAI